MNETDIYHLSHIIAGEVLGCPIMAYYALAWVYTRNKSWNGYGQPTDLAVFASRTWYKIEDPSFGASFMFSGNDLSKDNVRYLLLRPRGPPMVLTGIYHCNYDNIYTFAYRKDLTTQAPLKEKRIKEQEVLNVLKEYDINILEER